MFFTLQPEILCRGFLPPNDMKRPIVPRSEKAVGYGLEEDQFNQVINLVESMYRPIIAAKGGELEIQRLWTDETVDARAERQGNRYIIKMFGGLARHEAITQDSFALVVCHEIGHHLGGAPKMGPGDTYFWSSEGQADYFAPLKCLRRIFLNPSAASFTRHKDSDPVAEKSCSASFKEPAEQAVCLRSAMAGVSLSTLFNGASGKSVRLDTPDPAVVAQTYPLHPGGQCRLDTYFQGSLCSRPMAEELDDSDPIPGTCARSRGDVSGIRPLCWFKPPASEVMAQSTAFLSLLKDGGFGVERTHFP